ncbi:MAG TPA: hypothetical protein VJ901_02185 [Thermoanaerobaculia bacterium]|nr:hypothetical protein [Thermoanaerobaculia bacterium]
MNELAVEVALSGADPEEHFVYLSPHSDRRDGPETMSDYLNSGRRFFPMIAAGVARMVNRDEIVWVRYEKLPPVDDDGTIVEKLTILQLTDGTRVEGIVPISRPLEYSRISDVLNDLSEAFIRIDDDADTYYVNKRFIRLVIPR